MSKRNGHSTSIQQLPLQIMAEDHVSGGHSSCIHSCTCSMTITVHWNLSFRHRPQIMAEDYVSGGQGAFGTLAWCARLLLPGSLCWLAVASRLAGDACLWSLENDNRRCRLLLFTCAHCREAYLAPHS